MIRKLKLEPPFFEIGPKNYLFGDQVLDLARIADEAAKKYDVRVIYTTPYANIEKVAASVKNIHVFAPHMDDIPVGRGLACVLGESIKAAGAVGVMLNHAEKKLTLDEVKLAIERADEVGLATIVCADTVEEIRQIALLGPNLIVAEPTDLIGPGVASDMGYVRDTIEAVRKINPDIMVLQGINRINTLHLRIWSKYGR